jgi:hypothetical protein
MDKVGSKRWRKNKNQREKTIGMKKGKRKKREC